MQEAKAQSHFPHMYVVYYDISNNWMHTREIQYP